MSRDYNTPPVEGTLEALNGTLDIEQLVECLLFVADGPVPVAQLAQALDMQPRAIEAALEALEAAYAGRGLRLQRWQDRVQLTTAPAAAAHIERFLGLSATTRLSHAALETLAIVAYQQPVTRPHIDAVRGVNSDSVIKSLLTKGLIEEVGRGEGAGRPILYRTTPEFMQHFGLSSLTELPPLNLPEALAQAQAEQALLEAVEAVGQNGASESADEGDVTASAELVVEPTELGEAVEVPSEPLIVEVSVDEPVALLAESPVAELSDVEELVGSVAEASAEEPVVAEPVAAELSDVEEPVAVEEPSSQVAAEAQREPVVEDEVVIEAEVTLLEGVDDTPAEAPPVEAAPVGDGPDVADVPVPEELLLVEERLDEEPEVAEPESVPPHPAKAPEPPAWQGDWAPVADGDDEAQEGE